jgi:integration host factor subunit alpha
MSQTTVTRADIVQSIGEKFAVTPDISSKILEDLLDQMIENFAADKELKITGFGTFCIYHKRQRVGRNPKTGDEAVITPRRVVAFRASKILKQSMNAD